MPFSTLPAGTLPGQRIIAGARKPPSMTVPLLPRERRLSAVRPGEDFGAVVGGEDDDGVVVDAHVLELLHHRADDVVELRHAGFVDGPAVLRVAQRLVLRRDRCVTMCMRVGLSHRKNGLSSALALSMNLNDRSRISSSTVSIRFG